MDIQEAIFLNRQACLVDSFGYTNGFLIDAKLKAIEALEKWEKHAWHDLLKNPKDLPTDEKKKYLIAQKWVQTVTYEVASYAKSLRSIDEYDFADEPGGGFYNLDSEYGYCKEGAVLAWREIEPFEEEW